MSNDLREAEDKVAALSPAELAAFRKWFDEFEADAWDRQIEADIKAGKLDHLVERAKQQAAAGGRYKSFKNAAKVRPDSRINDLSNPTPRSSPA